MLGVDFAEDEAAAVDVDEDGEFGSGARRLEGVQWDVELEDQTLELVVWWRGWVAWERAAVGVAQGEDLRARVAGGWGVSGVVSVRCGGV